MVTNNNNGSKTKARTPLLGVRRYDPGVHPLFVSSADW